MAPIGSQSDIASYSSIRLWQDARGPEIHVHGYHVCSWQFWYYLVVAGEGGGIGNTCNLISLTLPNLGFFVLARLITLALAYGLPLNLIRRVEVLLVYCNFLDCCEKPVKLGLHWPIFGQRKFVFFLKAICP